MGRVGITQADVYRAAQAIAESGAFPTIQSVHARIGSGSLVTVHKHLLAWKQERLLAPAIKFESGKDVIKVKTLVNAKLDLEKIVQKQIEQNIAMSGQLLAVEQENLELKSNLAVTVEQVRNLSAENESLMHKVAAHDVLLAELKLANSEMLNIVLIDKNSEIEALKSELKTVHLASVEMVRKTSFEGQDLLMTERVKTINLNDQIKSLNAKIRQLEQKIDVNAKIAKDQNILQKNNKEIKSYTLAEIYAQKPLDAKQSDEGAA